MTDDIVQGLRSLLDRAAAGTLSTQEMALLLDLTEEFGRLRRRIDAYVRGED